MHREFTCVAIAQTSNHAQPARPQEDCYRGLIAAVLLQARKDLKRPGYRRSAERWLRSDVARHYAEMLDLEPTTVERLLHVRGGLR